MLKFVKICSGGSPFKKNSYISYVEVLTVVSSGASRLRRAYTFFNFSNFNTYSVTFCPQFSIITCNNSANIMLIDINSFNMQYLLFTLIVIAGVLAYNFVYDVVRSIRIFKKFKDIQITYDDCWNFHDVVALYIIRNF